MKTKLTLVLSLFLISYGIVLLVFFGRDLFKKDRPTINSYNDFSDEKYITLNTTNFFLGFAALDNNGDLFDLHSYNFFEYYYQNEADGMINPIDYNQPKIAVVKCKEEFLKDFKGTPSNIKEEILEYGYCLDLNNSLFKGSPLKTGIFKTISFRLNANYDKLYHSNETEKNEKFIWPLQLRFYAQNYIFKKDNYDDPFQKTIGIQEKIVLSWSYKIGYYLTFKTGVSERDDHFLLTKLNVSEIVGLNSFIETNVSTAIIDCNGQRCYQMLKTFLYFEPFKEIISRKYPKIQDIFTHIISFLQLGLIISEQIILIFGKIEVLNSIIAKNYNYSLKADNLSNSTLTKNYSNKMKTILETQNRSMEALNKSNIRTNNFISNNLQKNLKKSTLITNTDIINGKAFLKMFTTKIDNSQIMHKNSHNCCSKKNQIQKDIIKAHLDISNILRLYSEIRGIEMIMFDAEQFKIYKYLCKYDRIRDDYPRLIIDNGDKTTYLVKVFNYFKRKSQECQLNDSDKKILETIEFRLKEIISDRI